MSILWVVWMFRYEKGGWVGGNAGLVGGWIAYE